MGIETGRFLGVDDIWFGDHTRHFLPGAMWDPKTNPMARLVPDLDAWFDPTVLIARYCRKRGFRMGTSVTDPIRRSAADLARVWLSLHHVTGGNVVLGIGAGETNNLLPIGEARASVSRLEDCLDAIRVAWSADGARITHHGRFHSWDGATFPPPLRGSVPPIWVAAQGPRACGVAGRFADGWIHIHQDFEAWKTSAELVAKGADSVGKDPESMIRSLSILGVLASSDEMYERACASEVVRALVITLPGVAWTAAGASHPFGAEFEGTSSKDLHFFEAERFAASNKAVTPAVLRRLMPCGSAAQVAQYMEQFIRNGVSHVTVLNVAMAGGLRVAMDTVREQRKLNKILKTMRPGRLR
jgi:phthiodiolone/phenolphthiodiolone dimycocerosates ketoreductase